MGSYWYVALMSSTPFAILNRGEVKCNVCLSAVQDLHGAIIRTAHQNIKFWYLKLESWNSYGSFQKLSKKAFF